MKQKSNIKSNNLTTKRAAPNRRRLWQIRKTETEKKREIERMQQHNKQINKRNREYEKEAEEEEN